MRIALVHDHLNQIGGAEKVLQALHRLWPSAPIFTLLYDLKKTGGIFAHATVHESFLGRVPLARRFFSWMLPLMPTATENYDLADFDVVISSSSGFAKGVLTRPETLHICYCHTPTRYLWSDSQAYVEELRRVPRFVKRLLPLLLTPLRVWDKLAADRVDVFVANSRAVSRRIKKYYRRDSIVIHPPVETDRFAISSQPKSYFLTGGRLVAYKRFDIVVDACTKAGLPLVVFGSGPMEEDLKRRAGPTVRFVGRVDAGEQARLYANATAFIHQQEEDFGITPIEAMASGRPVIAYRRGGVIESVVEGETGVFFDTQSWECLADLLMRFDARVFDPEKIRRHAQMFSTAAFEHALQELVSHAYAKHQKNLLCT